MHPKYDKLTLKNMAKEIIEESKRGKIITSFGEKEIEKYETMLYVVDLGNESKKYSKTKFEVWESSVVDSIIKLRGKNVCVLNFADYKTPGGGFITGNYAQEESLCHASNLYLSLIDNIDWYDKHKYTLNYGLYTDDYILSKNICVFKDSEFKYIDPLYVDILTCAAPNAKVVRRYRPQMKNAINNVLRDRLEVILSVMSKGNYTTIILGAFGCGAFGNDIKVLLDIYIDLFNNKYKNVFDNVIFSIPIFNDKEYGRYRLFKVSF